MLVLPPRPDPIDVVPAPVAAAAAATAAAAAAEPNAGKSLGSKLLVSILLLLFPVLELIPV